MPRDYARTSRRSTRESKRGLWITVLILIILFAAGLFYLKHHSTVLVKTVTNNKETHEKPNTHQQRVNNNNSTQQNFDFYTLLPKNQAAPQDNSNVAKGDTINRVSTKNPIYAVQVGEFKGYAAADELKAKVVLQGYETTITPVKKSNVVLYKVWLGPYTTREQALQQQKDLAATQIKSVIITLKKN